MGWVQEAADHLAPMIAMIENILDPETIILGGMLPDAIIDDLIWHMGGLPISVASRRAVHCRASSADRLASSLLLWVLHRCRCSRP